jgi:HAD superfamily hydrolase (TIGR01509 family)
VRRPGLIFDFDGTIALSEPVHMAAWGDVAAAFGQALPAGFAERGCGQPDELLARELASGWGRAPAELLRRKAECYQLRCRAGSTLVPGVVELLRRFHGRRPIGLATSASAEDIAPTLAQHDLRRFFDVILTVEQVANPKPHPEIYLLVAERLGLDPGRSVVFEDSPPGAAAARAAGMRVFGMTTSFALASIGPVEHGFDDFTDLERIAALIG